LVLAKLVSLCEKCLEELLMTFFALQLKLGWHFFKAETPSQNF